MEALKEWAVKVLNHPKCRCGKDADFIAKFYFTEKEEATCNSCQQDFEAQAMEIDTHELRQFGGAYGLTPRPHLTTIKKPDLDDLARAIKIVL